MNASFKLLDKFTKKGFFGGTKHFFVLQLVEDRRQVQEQRVDIGSYYNHIKGDTITAKMYQWSDGKWRFREE